jgi:hypothetical protein
MKVTDWLARIRAVSTPFGGITFGDTQRPIETQDDAIRRFVGHLLYLKERGLALTEGTNGQRFITGLENLVSFLHLYHGLLPSGRWRVVIVGNQCESVDPKTPTIGRRCGRFGSRKGCGNDAG